MKGRIYLIKAKNSLKLVQEIESIGDGEFLYEVSEGSRKVAKACNIFMFCPREEYYGKNYEHDCNSLDELLIKVTISKYNKSTDPRYEMSYDYRDDCNYLTQICAVPTHRYKELFDPITANALDGTTRTTFYIGSKGTIVLSAPFKSLYVTVEWDKFLAPYSPSIVKVYNDGFKYIVTYVDSKDKQGVGYSRMANYIYNYISAHPNGVSSMDVEKGLKMRHPSVAGRISELDHTGRIQRVNTVRYHRNGKPNSVWIVTER